MDCSKFEELVSEYLDAQLQPPDASRFAAHSLQCRACRALLDEVKAALRECKQPSEILTPTDLEATLAMIPLEHMPLECEGFQELITEFLDGYVPAHAYQRFESHASSCAGCSSLLTEVVYAVAACHSVHTYEEYDVPVSLAEGLLTIMPEQKTSLRRSITDRAAALVSLIMPSRTQSAPWSFATASMLVFATLGFLLIDFSDDLTPSGIYRQAHLRVAELYSTGAELYAQKDEVAARIQRVGSDIGDIWETIGGEDPPLDTDQQKDSKKKRKNKKNKQAAQTEKY